MSHIARLFLEDDLNSGLEVDLPDSQTHYVLRVMRMSDGALVRAFNGRDGEWQCRLRVAGKRAHLVPETQTRPQTSGSDLILLFAPIKKARTDFIVEKATELGVRTLQPVFTEYTQSNRVRTDRMRLLAIEAAEQTERMDIPEIREGAALAKVVSCWDSSRPLIFCDESADARPLQSAMDSLSGAAAGVLIGPEGGFSPRERQMLSRPDFVVPITLGPRILRAETAAVAALTLWQSHLGDWQKRPYLPER